MRKIKQTSAFKRDIKRESTAANVAALNNTLPVILYLLAEDKPMPEVYQDHALEGNWIRHRECHVKPDLLLIYHKRDEGILTLSRLGSHPKLFGK
jgi:mRNA interferase YafQ